MKIERAAKLVLHSPEGIILPYGESGRLNLPGGGIDKGELPIEALERELEEELGYPLGELNPVWLGEKTFITTSKTGRMQKRQWDIFTASTDFGPNDFMYGDDIQGVEALPREKMYGNERVNRSAKIATALAYKACRTIRSRAQ